MVLPFQQQPPMMPGGGLSVGDPTAPMGGSPPVSMGGMMPPMGMPQPAAMGMSPVDPMQAAMADPMTMISLINLIIGMDEKKNGPVYPRWYRPADYPKPVAAAYTEKAVKDKDLHELLIRRINAEREILQLKRVGQFPDAEEESEMQFQDPSLVHDFNLVVNLVAGCDVNFEARHRKEEDREVSESKEIFSHAFRERWIRRNHLMYGTDLRYDEVRLAAGTGRLVARFSLDFDSESDQVPVRADLLDPTTCFPTWDGERGMAAMTRVYSQTVGQIVSSFDDGKNGLKKKLLSKTAKDMSQGRRLQTLDDQVEVIEYWDRRWYAVAVDGEEILNAEHRYGFVPFVYLISPLGDAGPQSLHALITGARGRSSTVKEDIAAKGLSHIWATWKAHEQREAILGRMFTELKKTGNPPRTFSQDMSVYGEAPAVSDQEGAVNMIRAGLEQEVPGPRKEGFSLLGPIMSATNEAAARGLLPASAYGLTQNANESGTAIEGLNESGRDKLTPWLTMMERWDTACAEMAMTLFRDWGHMLGSDGQRGEFEIPLLEAPTGKPDIVVLKPEDLRTAGVTIRSKRTSLRLSNLGALGNSLSIWKQNGWLLDSDALEMRGVENPLAYLRQVEIQEMKKDPEYQKLAIIRMLQEEGDFEGALIYQRMTMGQTQQQRMPEPGVPPDSNPGAPGGPGTMGGSPPGSGMGPQIAQPQQGSMGMPSRMAGPPPSSAGII